MYTIANCPAVQRDLYLARCLRRAEDAPAQVGTLSVAWDDMVVSFAADGAISEASVQVSENISIARFTARMESLLDCGAKSESAAEWVVKFSCRISNYGSAEEVRRLLCDKVASLDADTGETVGVLKIKRRSVDAGHAKVRLVPADDSLQLVVRHQTAQGLKAVWKSVLWRLRPQFPARREAVESEAAASAAIKPVAANHGSATVVVAPCIGVISQSYDWSHYAVEVSRLGGTLDVEAAKKNGICLYFPLGANEFQGFGHWDKYGSSWYNTNYSGQYVCTVQLKKISGTLPEGLSLDNEGEVSVCSHRYTEFRQRAQALSDWLGLGWNLPTVPADSNENKPAK